jgi:S1-C subfamily serine protease
MRIVPIEAEPPVDCDGIRGDARLTCSDGREIRVGWASEETCRRGAGQGQDADGHGLRLTFGGSRARAAVIAEDAMASGSRLPKLPAPGEAQPTQRSAGPSTGTAFFVTWDGHLITNHHVVRDAERIQVQMDDGELIDAEVVHLDSDNDLALLRVEAIRRPLPVESSFSVRRGGEVFTLGYPLITLQGQDQKATFGHVNSVTGMQGDERFTQIDVPIQPGNSGGPLLDNDGDVVGVVTSMLHPRLTLETIGVVPQNVNYAIKSDFVHRIMLSELPEGWKSDRLPEKERSYQELVEASERSVVLILAW